jgi:ubiquinone/menaquinone biosynthesis C-methylase UbiE
VSEHFEARTAELEVARQLPGLNTVDYNRELWSRYDWSARGEEWSVSPEWERSLVDHVMYRYLTERDRQDVLEIGPGAGRWTAPLHQHATTLALVDITETTLELCRRRLGDPANVTYWLTDGSDLAAVQPDSIDFIWSFDAFVHIAPNDVRGYIADFPRVLRAGGRGVIHHPGEGRIAGGVRSGVTAELFASALTDAGLQVLEQFDSWGPDRRHSVPVRGDVITVFERP